jgi:Mlc titration factor MtfA (ptsG expression regulator)
MGALVLFTLLACYFLFQLFDSKDTETASPYLDEDYEGFVQLSQMPSDPELHAILLETFAYYHLLVSSEQAVFRVRLRKILGDKWFTGRDGLEVDDRMILQVGATMAQLTLGIERFYFPRFDRIVLFPDAFYSKLFEKDVKGMTVFHTGVVLISWPHYQEGYSNPTDRLNLGLHEMAHALYLDYFGHRRMLYGFDRWSIIALPVFEEMQRNTQHPFLRKYAGSNMHEFWAVCVEHFFEAPIEFREKLPVLYKAMCQILRQDMARRMDKYRIKRSYEAMKIPASVVA